MKSKFFVFGLMLFSVLVMGCGPSYQEQKRISKAEQDRLRAQNDSALKIAVLPTLDCLPMFIANEDSLFAASGEDIRLKYFTAQMDCDTALAGGSVEGSISDLVRAQRLMSKGTPLDLKIATSTYWQLITSRTARIKELKQLDDKMVAMTNFSATDMLSDKAVKEGKLKSERVFRIPVNDVLVRLNMLQNKEMDAMFLTEPQATAARIMKHRVLADSRKQNLQLGVIVFRAKGMKATYRQQQMTAFCKAYNQACDSITRYGFKHYSKLIQKYCKVAPNVVDSLPSTIKYSHIQGPRQKDVAAAAQWLRH
jgi:NitT/TauT family transport system substrate-binding protein